MPIILYLAVLFLLLEVLSFFYARLFSQLNFLRFAIILGIFLHEFSHYLACKLTFAKVKKFHIGRRTGYVVHSKSKIPIIGSLLISFAPLFVGLASLVAIVYFLNNNHDLLISSFTAAKSANWAEMVSLLKSWIFNLDYSSWQFWLSLFLSLNILATFTPSKKDYKNIVGGILIYGILSFYVSALSGVNLILIYILLFANVLLLVAIVLLIILNLIAKLLHF